MRLLVTGANGLLGSNVVATARNRGWDVVGTYHSTAPSFDVGFVQLDITESERVREVIADVDPEWVVNCAAMTDVDECEERPDQATAVNATAPGAIASACSTNGVRLLHVSTDYVFDGAARERYDEDASVGPIQAYGESKLRGERAVRETGSHVVVARPSFVYGIHRSRDELDGFPAWVRDRLADREVTQLFTDQYVTPSRAGAVAETFCEIVEGDGSGTYHVASRTCVSPFEFGVAIAERLAADRDLVAEGSLSATSRPAERPSFTCLDVSKVEAELGRPQPTLEQDLDAIRGAFERQH